MNLIPSNQMNESHAITLNVASAVLLAGGVVRIHGLPYKPSQVPMTVLIHALPSWEDGIDQALNGAWGEYMLKVPSIESADDLKDLMGFIVGQAVVDEVVPLKEDKPRPGFRKARTVGWAWGFVDCKLFDKPVPYQGHWDLMKMWKVNNG